MFIEFLAGFAIPFASHTKYWDEHEDKAKRLLNDTI